MRLAPLINAAIVCAAIALVPGMATAQTSTTNTSTVLTPFNIAFLAYQGYLKSAGIPSGSALLLEYQRGSLSVNDVVQAAVKANRLSAEVLQDKGYLSAVEMHLESLSRDRESPND